MKKRKNMKVVLIILFIIVTMYIISVKTVDVQAIGPNGSAVGFATINGWFHQMIGLNDTWYKITKYLGVLPFLYVLFYGIIGMRQLLNTKSIKKMDKKIIALGCFYVAVGLVYILFEKVIINYRPVILDDSLEASFPSSHTMLAICVCLSAMFMNSYYIKNDSLRKKVNIATWILMILLVLGRLLSGVHWFTDILGGVIISLFLVFGFYMVCQKSK